MELVGREGKDGREFSDSDNWSVNHSNHSN